MAGDSVTVSQGHFVGTLRRDAWWTEILPAALLLGVFGIYATYLAPLRAGSMNGDRTFRLSIRR